MRITKAQIKAGLKRLGLKKGASVMVHSSLSSLGEVAGGADAVIDALLETVGEKGTVLMPAFALGGVFDREKTSSEMGLISETFRRRPGVLRSSGPSHSVCARGGRARELIKGHLRARSGCGKGTPYSRLIEWGGYILLIGVDQDRSTTLHAVEAYTRRPYLSRRTVRYRDSFGKEREKTLELHPGPHRDFIGLDRFLREAGVMKIRKIGGAVCRLIDARGMARVVEKEIECDPAAVLCRNPHCWDCVQQRQKLGHPPLKKEDFALSVLSDEISSDITEAVEVINNESIGYLELRTVGGKEVTSFSERELKRIKRRLAQGKVRISALNLTSRPEKPGTSAARALRGFRKALDCARLLDVKNLILAAPRVNRSPSLRKKVLNYFQSRVDYGQTEGIKLLIENRPGTYCDSSAACEDIIRTINSPGLRLAFNPANFARTGEKPFRGIAPRIRKLAEQLYICDALFKMGPYQPAGFGNGEVKELISILRCRSFSGFFTLKSGFGKGRVNFVKALRAFWDILETV